MTLNLNLIQANARPFFIHYVCKLLMIFVLFPSQCRTCCHNPIKKIIIGIKIRSAIMFWGFRMSLKDMEASTTCFQSVSTFCGCYQVFYTICISWLGQRPFLNQL